MTNSVEKPNWNDAPTWANYLAQDSDGRWWWYATEPKRNKHTSTWKSSIGTYELACGNEQWENTLEKRPLPITSIWDLLPQNVKYIAMDRGGTWYGYQEKPCLDENDEDGMWSIDADEFYAEMLEDLISFDGSLIQRPD